MTHSLLLGVSIPLVLDIHFQMHAIVQHICLFILCQDHQNTKVPSPHDKTGLCVLLQKTNITFGELTRSSERSTGTCLGGLKEREDVGVGNAYLSL